MGRKAPGRIRMIIRIRMNMVTSVVTVPILAF
jgi:hypothetical protein